MPSASPAVKPVDISLEKKHNFETALHIGNNQKLSELLSIEYGLRYSHFQYMGPGTIYTYNDTIPGAQKRVIDSRKYNSGENIVTYSNFEPRFSFKVQTTETSSIKGSYNRMAQYLHLISNTTASNPLDVWNPSSK